MIDSALEAGPPSAMNGDGNALPFATIRAAIAARETLTIGYQNAAGRSSIREARPLGLTLFENAWLVTIWCEIAQDFRHLRLDRITSLNRTGKRFRMQMGKRFKDAIDLERSKLALQALGN